MKKYNYLKTIKGLIVLVKRTNTVGLDRFCLLNGLYLIKAPAISIKE